jgi:hypothetical protein
MKSQKIGAAFLVVLVLTLSGCSGLQAGKLSTEMTGLDYE